MCVNEQMCAFVFLIEVKKESEDGDEPRAETESESEEELSCFAPTVRVHSHPKKSNPCVESTAADGGADCTLASA